MKNTQKTKNLSPIKLKTQQCYYDVLAGKIPSPHFDLLQRTVKVRAPMVCFFPEARTLVCISVPLTDLRAYILPCYTSYPLAKLIIQYIHNHTIL